MNDIANKKNKSLLGKVLDVLVEGKSKYDDTKLMGRTRTSKLVNFAASEGLIGHTVPVKITVAKTFSFNGELQIPL